MHRKSQQLKSSEAGTRKDSRDYPLTRASGKGLSCVGFRGRLWLSSHAAYRWVPVCIALW
ncbi:hypothetical protein C7S14_2912 [Burkholderia cepacia]|nr:hypothetical protein C7S14_2912 [Burkholderia cepacia]